MEACVRRVPTYGPAWIIEDLNGLTPLTSLACKNRIDLLLLLLTRLRRLNRADLNFPDLYGNTVLHYLALRRNDVGPLSGMSAYEPRGHQRQVWNLRSLSVRSRSAHCALPPMHQHSYHRGRLVSPHMRGSPIRPHVDCVSLRQEQKVIQMTTCGRLDDHLLTATQCNSTIFHAERERRVSDPQNLIFGPAQIFCRTPKFGVA